MSPSDRSRFSKLDRHNWWLWAITFAALIAVTATVPVLYAPLLDLTAGNDQYNWWIRDNYLVGVGLGGLVVLLCLYVTLKQKQLNQVRHVMERDRAELEDIRVRLSEISALFGTTTALNLQLKLDAILEIIARRVVAAMGAQQASVMIYNPETGVLETRASYGLESEFARDGRLRLGEGIAGVVAQRREAVLLGADESDERFRRHYKPARNITSALSLPLLVGDRCVGVLNVNRINHPSQFRVHHRDLLRLFAEHVGSVIDRAEVMERLAARTQVLEATNQQLNELNRMKDVFLSTASHELRTPLTSVIGYAEILRDDRNRLSSEERDEFLRRLDNEANTLLSLIEDILDLSRLENGKLVLEREPCSIDDIVQAAVATVQPMAEKYGVKLSQLVQGGLPKLALDMGKMRQVVVNLLTNAIKFSPENSTVTVAAREDHDFVAIDVHDCGPGVRPEDQVQIFELFGQGARPGKERAGGLGIGLHLVKRITELHGGHVGVQSALGQGSTFSIRLPVTPAEVVPQAA